MVFSLLRYLMSYMQVEGYPQSVLLLVLGVGLLLALLRPYGAFLFGLFLITAGHTGRFNQTRLTGLGPYLNLSDACVLVAIMALFLDKLQRREPLRVPQIVPVMLFVLVIAALQSFWKLGWTYDTIRALRWGVQLPVFLFLGANLVISPVRARSLVTVLLAAAIFAAIQHLSFVANVWRSQSLDMETYQAMRTISYWGGGMASAFLVTGVIWRWRTTISRRLFYSFLGVLFLATVFLNQTRSLWLATAATLPCLLLLFNVRCSLRRLLRLGLMFCVGSIVFASIVQRALPGIDPARLLRQRIETLAIVDRRFGSQTATRNRDFKVEMTQWLEGTLVFGRGLAFFQTIPNPRDADKYVAFGHLGYVTYLSQLGLIGLFVYGFYFPISVIQKARRLWSSGDAEVLCYVGLLAGASIICLSLMFVMSSQFLSPGFEAPGVLYGSTLVLARSPRETTIRNDLVALELEG